ncbi:hypothetical protein F5Y19DRAFT_458155 [Xylariaceae sp. FL1651]|nr:hypothetical protein F5Y19DRAFT_458155 [Xylariaceae sp. FL1651]
MVYFSLILSLFNSLVAPYCNYDVGFKVSGTFDVVQKLCVRQEQLFVGSHHCPSHMHKHIFVSFSVTESCSP